MASLNVKVANCFYFLYNILPNSSNHEKQVFVHMIAMMIRKIRECEAEGWQFEPHGPALECLVWI